MSKITLNHVASFQNDSSAVATVNADLDTIQTAFDNTLSRDGTSPNQMSASIDMNSHRVLNPGMLDMAGQTLTGIPAPTNPTDAIRYIDMLNLGGGGGGNVLGPSTNTADNIPQWNGANSKVLKDGLSVAALATAVAALLPITGANPTASVGLTAVNGSASTYMRSDGAPALSQSISPTWTGVHTFQPSSGNGPTINTGANTNAHGLVVSQVPASFTVAGSYIYNSIDITDNNNFSTGGTPDSSAGNGLTVNLSAGGASTKGGRQAFTANARIIGTIAAAPANDWYVGGAFGAFANAAPGGGAGTERGRLCGINPVVTIEAVATHINGAKGMEIDLTTKAGCSLLNRVGIDIVLGDGVNASAVQGSTYDRAMQINATTGSAGFKQGFVFDSFGGAAPIDSSGTLLLATASGGGPGWSITNGVDLSGVTVSGSAFKSTGFSVDGSGNITTILITHNTTGGAAGYSEYKGGTSPGAPGTLGWKLFCDTNGRFSWIQQTDGQVRQFAGPLTANRVYTLQDSNHTLVGRDTTDTLTNKTFNAAVGGNVFQINSNTISSNTGTGAVNVLSSSPTIATPTFTGSIVTPIIGPAADSTTAVLITKSNLSTAVVTVDTTNNRVGINKTPGAYDVDIAGKLNVSSTQSANSSVNGSIVSAGGISCQGFQLWTSTTALGFMGSVLTWTGSGLGTDCAFACNGANFKLFTNNSTTSTITLSSTGTTFDKGSVLSLSASGGLGYGTGAGNTVTQITNKSTGVTINTPTGAITTHNASLAATTSIGFTVTNSSVAATDTVIVNIKSGATVDSYTVMVDSVGAGSFRISIRNYTAGALGEALVLNYAVIKGVTS